MTPCKEWFLTKKLLLENTQVCLCKSTNWILMGNFFVTQPPVRKAFGIRMVNSLSYFFLHISETQKIISPTISTVSI